MNVKSKDFECYKEISKCLVESMENAVNNFMIISQMRIEFDESKRKFSYYQKEQIEEYEMRLQKCLDYFYKILY